MSDSKKCKVTKEGKDKDCVCNTELCNRDANGDANGAGTTGAAGLLATVLLALAMARI